MEEDHSKFDWRLREKPGLSRCALCHGEYSPDDWIICIQCGTQGHGDCFRGEDLCPTLGCDESHGVQSRTAPLRQHGRGVSLEALTLAGIEQALRGPETVQQRVIKQWKIRRLLSFLNLTVDDIVNDRAAKKRLLAYFKIQRQSERRGQEQKDDVDDDYQDWVQSQI
ncbi:MAG: PHD finger domain-containing protein [Planctomycetota bacterium]|nr:PHD finger domain-containing protein [Planctomycetota bacterium]